MRNIIASTAIIALVAATGPGLAQAAGINVDSATYDAGTTSVTVIDTDKDYTLDEIAGWSLVTSAGDLVATGDSTQVNEGNEIFTITDTVNFSALGADTYTLAFSTVSGDFSAAIVAVGGANQVAVTAVVEPAFTFSLDTNAISLGLLPASPDTYETGTAIVSVNSNVGGTVQVGMSSQGLASATREIGVSDINPGLEATSGTDYYKITINPAPAITDENGSDISDPKGVDMDDQQTVANITTPVGGATVSVTVGARADVSTESGSYSDTLTFTAAQSF